MHHVRFSARTPPIMMLTSHSFDIMGSTLARVKKPSSIPETLQLSFLELLQKSEDKTWIGCPAELLYLLSTIHSLLSASPTLDDRQEELSAIWNMLEHFSPSEWSAKSSRMEHYESRLHLASAYKAAVEIYAAHVLGTYHPSTSWMTHLVQRAVVHVVSIPSNDFHIKSLVWPAFIIGAETEAGELRDMLRRVFQQIWVVSCCRNARNAGDVLEILWNRTLEERVRRTWLEYMYEEGGDWLFV